MTKLIRTLAIVLGAPALALFATIAGAHHSAAQFDFSQRVTIQGVVKEFNVTNPHTEAFVDVTDAKGTRTVAVRRPQREPFLSRRLHARHGESRRQDRDSDRAPARR